MIDTRSVHTQPRVWLGWLLAAAWMGMIFFASTDRFSASHTSRFIEPFLRWLTGGRVREETLENIHFLIRKLAHVSEYSLLAVLLWNALWQTASRREAALPRPSERHVTRLAFALAVLFAASDEFHQMFVPSRGASVHDVAIDAVGAFVGLTILRGSLNLRRRLAGSSLRPDRF